MDSSKPKKTESTKHLEALNRKVGKFLAESNDSDILIIKAHLICEYYLNQILILKGLCEAKDINNMTFSEKNQKALSKTDKMESETYESLRALNRLRNRVGHELEYVISESDVDSLGLLKGKEYVLRKYDFESNEELLRDTLIAITVDVSYLLFEMVDAEKKLKVTDQKPKSLEE